MAPNGSRLCEWVGGCSHYGHRPESKDSTMKLHNSHCDNLLLECSASNLQYKSSHCQ